MQAVKMIVGCLVLGVVGFFAGGLFARFFLISGSQGFEGATTAAVAAFVGAAIGIVIAVLVLRR